MKKAIIFDCDNTLWKGVVGEEEVLHDSEIQQDILFLVHRGVIIGLCSKNNEEDILRALEGQVLMEEFISVKRINWKDKASNLKEIAQELNIGLDAIMFVDDSEFERELVKAQLPEVLTIHPKDLMVTVLENFNLTGNITKTQQYRENYLRAKAQEQFADISEYLASLNMVLTIKVNDTSQIPRIAELTQKTNQFNLTTERYTEDEIREVMDGLRVYSLSVKDRFGDNGLTGVCIISQWDVPQYAIISVFLLSCRILGRGIEYAFMDYIMKDLKKLKYLHVYGEYIPTQKNKQVENFYSDLGFKRCEGDPQEFVYWIDISKYEPHAKLIFCYE